MKNYFNRMMQTDRNEFNLTSGMLPNKCDNSKCGKTFKGGDKVYGERLPMGGWKYYCSINHRRK